MWVRAVSGMQEQYLTTTTLDEYPTIACPAQARPSHLGAGLGCDRAAGGVLDPGAEFGAARAPSERVGHTQGLPDGTIVGR